MSERTGTIMDLVNAGVTRVVMPSETPMPTPDEMTIERLERERDEARQQLRKAEVDMALLRNALAGMVGASDKAELEQMELAVRVLPAPESDKIASLNVIHALLATLPNK